MKDQNISIDDIRRIKLRKRLSDSQKELSSLLYQKGVISESGFSTLVNIGYKTIFGKSAKALKKEKGIKQNSSLRDFLPPLELMILDLANILTKHSIQENNVFGEKNLFSEYAKNIKKVSNLILDKKFNNQTGGIINEAIIGKEASNIAKKLNIKNENNISEVLESYDLEKKKNNIFYTEDEKVQIYKIAWLKYKNISCNDSNFDSLFAKFAPFEIYGVNGHTSLKQKINHPSLQEFEGKRVLALFDFDSAFKSFYDLDKRREIIDSDDSDGLKKKRIDSDNFIAMMLPIPKELKNQGGKRFGAESRIDVELLFFGSDNEYIKKCFNIQDYIGGGKIIEFGGTKKSTFRKKIIILEPKEFKNFTPIFTFTDSFFA